MWNTYETRHEIKDTVKAVVTVCTKKGVYLKLDNGETAFAKFGNLQNGTEVLCSIVKYSTLEWPAFVTIDSVLSRDLMAA